MNLTILTPIQLEFNAVKSHLTGGQPVLGSRYLTINGKFKGRFHEFNVTVLQTDAKNAEMALATEYAANQFKPAIMMLVGIGGGVKDVTIGDIVVGEKTYSYESGKETEEGFKARPETYQYNKALINLAKQVAGEEDWKRRTKVTAKEASVKFGAICSGDKVIATINSPIYQRIKDFFNDSLCVDMEGFGFAKAASHYPLIPIMHIRGISDLLESKSETDALGGQDKAIDHAAAFLFEILNQLNLHHINHPLMEAKKMANELYDRLLPIAMQEAGQWVDISINPYDNVLIERVKPLVLTEYEELVEDSLDEDVQGSLKMKLRRLLKKDEALLQELSILIEQAKENKLAGGISVENSKNTLMNNELSAGRDMDIGDKTTNIEKQQNNSGTIEKQHNIDKINAKGNVYISDVINVYNEKNQVPKEKGDKVALAEAIQKLISKNKIKPAIKLLLNYSKDLDEDLHEQVLAQSRRWTKLKKEEMLGVVSSSEANTISNRIVYGLLGIVRDLNQEED